MPYENNLGFLIITGEEDMENSLEKLENNENLKMDQHIPASGSREQKSEMGKGLWFGQMVPCMKVFGSTIKQLGMEE